MKLAPLSKSIPQFTWEDVRVSFAPHQVERLKDAGMMTVTAIVTIERHVNREHSSQLLERAQEQPFDFSTCAAWSRSPDS